jgi:hypothetical protein
VTDFSKVVAADVESNNLKAIERRLYDVLCILRAANIVELTKRHKSLIRLRPELYTKVFGNDGPSQQSENTIPASWAAATARSMAIHGPPKPAYTSKQWTQLRQLKRLKQLESPTSPAPYPQLHANTSTDSANPSPEQPRQPIKVSKRPYNLPPQSWTMLLRRLDPPISQGVQHSAQPAVVAQIARKRRSELLRYKRGGEGPAKRKFEGDYEEGVGKKQMISRGVGGEEDCSSGNTLQAAHIRDLSNAVSHIRSLSEEEYEAKFEAGCPSAAENLLRVGGTQELPEVGKLS